MMTMNQSKSETQIVPKGPSEMRIGFNNAECWLQNTADVSNIPRMVDAIVKEKYYQSRIELEDGSVILLATAEKLKGVHVALLKERVNQASKKNDMRARLRAKLEAKKK